MTYLKTGNSRALRYMNDYSVNNVGTPCVMYRNVSETSIEQTKEINDVDRLWNEAKGSDEALSNYSTPFETKVLLDIPENIRITERGNLDYEGEDPMQAQFKFADYVTPNSYFKVPFTNVFIDNDGEDITSESSELPVVARFEITSFETSVVIAQHKLIANIDIMRASDRLRDDDTEPLSHIPSDFWDGRLD